MKEKIAELLIEAMKEGNKLKVSVYRSLKADIETAEKNGDSNELLSVAKAKKKRLDAAEEYKKCGRDDLAEIELSEAEIINEFLPKEPSYEEVMGCIRKYAESFSFQMGLIIRHVKDKYPTLNGGKLAEMVRFHLSIIK